MNEIDLIRSFRASTSSRNGTGAQRARTRLMDTVDAERGSDPHQSWALVGSGRHRPSRRVVFTAAAFLALPTGYAVGKTTGVFGGGTVVLTPETATPAPPPQSESKSARRLPEGTIVLTPQTATPAPPPADSGSARRAPGRVIRISPGTAKSVGGPSKDLR